MINEKDKEEIIKDFQPIIDSLIELLKDESKNYNDKISGLEFKVACQYLRDEYGKINGEIIHNFVRIVLKEEIGKAPYSSGIINFEY